MAQTLATLAARYNQFAPDPELHGSYYPTDIYPGESISATIRSTEDQHHIASELRVWRLSPLGLEILIDDDENGPPVGQRIDIDLRIGLTTTSLSGLTVVKTRNQLGHPLVGVRLIESNKGEFHGVERRHAARWICGEHFVPVCVAMNPARFNDFVYFRVKDISPHGMKLHTSLRNKFLVRGMKLECIASFPLVSQITVNTVIENVHLTTENGKDYLALGVSFENLKPHDRQILGQYLIQFGDGVTVEELRSGQLVPRSVAQALEFSFVRTLDDYQQVLRLRHLAYRRANKIPETYTPEDMGDLYDTRSRIVIGKYKGRVVATAGLVFNEYHDRMEIEESVEWPDSLPRRDQMVEVIRNCTDPDFRGSDVLMAMFQFIAITIFQAKRRYAVIGCTPELVALYSRIGMQKQDIEYRHRKLGDSPHTVMIGDIGRGMTGASINPLLWNAVWAKTAGFMIDSDQIHPSQGDRLRMNLYRLLQPLSLILQRRMMRPRRQSR